MRPDIVNLRQFYSSRLGRKVRARLAALVRAGTAVRSGEVLLGIGYANPILPAPDKESGKVIALLPMSQGAIYWPVHGANRSVLGDELRPPFAPGSLHCVVLAHALEHLAQPQELLAILWQLLAPGGRLLLVVPNRRGLWASIGATPFAQGTPYTLAKLKELLNDAQFTLREAHGALYAPPSAHPFWMHSWWLLEWLGRMCVPRMGGVHVVEAEKQIYAGLRIPAVSAKRAAKWVGQEGVPA